MRSSYVVSTNPLHCHRLSSTRYGLLNLPDTRRTMQHKQSIRSELIGQAGEKNLKKYYITADGI